MEEIYVNVSSPKSVLPGPGSRSSGGNTSRCLPLCLGLLILALLAGLAVVSVFFYLSAAELVVVRANLSQTLLACANKTLHRGPLPTILAEGTEAPDRRQETCPAGWTVFKDFCYLFAREVRSWEASRQSCRQAGADLVVIHGPEEQDFLTGNTTMHTWIGLTDIETEGTWKWIDGSPLTEAYWRPGQPDNWIPDPALGDEDCVYLTNQENLHENWNDANCIHSFHWVCKKKLS